MMRKFYVKRKLYRLLFPSLSLSCRGEKTWEPEYGGDFDCAYDHAGEITCSQCVCGGGIWNPETAKKISLLERIFVRAGSRQERR